MKQLIIVSQIGLLGLFGPISLPANAEANEQDIISEYDIEPSGQHSAESFSAAQLSVIAEPATVDPLYSQEPSEGVFVQKIEVDGYTEFSTKTFVEITQQVEGQLLADEE